MNPANNIISQKVVRAIDDLVDRSGTALVVVHTNTTGALYQSASKGKVSLFYSPIPMRPTIISGRKVVVSEGEGEITDYISEDYAAADYYRKFIHLEDFSQRVRRALRFNPREYYYVRPEKALVLLEMVRGCLNPDEIIVYLGSENRVTSEKEILVKTNLRRLDQ